MQKKIVVTVVILAGLYLLFGYIAIKFNVIQAFTEAKYFQSAAVVGGIASVFGLLGLTLPSLTMNDIRRVELDGLRRVADLAEEMQDADKKLEETSAEIDSLEQKRTEMELLVRKASLSLHLQGRLERVVNDMTELYQEKQELEARLIALGEEVAGSADKAIIEEITQIVRQKEISTSELTDVFWMKPSFFGIGIDLNALIKRIAKMTRK